MITPYTEVYVHLVWATWDRQPLLTGETEAAAYACIRTECAVMGVEIVAIGGMEDHVHLLIRLPMTLSIAAVVKQVKGATSHMLTHKVGHENFKWQGAYGAFSVEKKSVPVVQRYVDLQKERHADGSLWPTLETIYIEI
jgi:putative transposase